MKLKFLATGQAPDYYTIYGEVITAHYDGKEEVIDLSDFPQGAQWQPGEPEVLDLPSQAIIRNVERTDDLYVTLCQRPPVTKITYLPGRQTLSPDEPAPDHDSKIEHRGGHWKESGWIDNFQPKKLYIQKNEDIV